MTDSSLVTEYGGILGASPSFFGRDKNGFWYLRSTMSARRGKREIGIDGIAILLPIEDADC